MIGYDSFSPPLGLPQDHLAHEAMHEPSRRMERKRDVAAGVERAEQQRWQGSHLLTSFGILRKEQSELVFVPCLL